MEQIAIFLKMTLVTARSNRGAALGANRELAGFEEGILPQQRANRQRKASRFSQGSNKEVSSFTLGNLRPPESATLCVTLVVCTVRS
jgi:hypothetical protein